jgi:hypothetical protein
MIIKPVDTANLLGGGISLGALPQTRTMGNDLSANTVRGFGNVPTALNPAALAQMRPSDDDFHSLTENEDFPALPTASKTDGLVSKDSAASVLGAVGSAVEKGRASSIGSSHGDSSSVLGATPQQASGGTSGLLANLNTAVSSTPVPTNMTKEMKYGLAGLLEIIRGTDKVRRFTNDVTNLM